MTRRLSRIWFGVLSLTLLFPRPTLALQTHGPPEGLYVHQLAHVLFAGALLFLIWQIRREGMAKALGFRRLIWACSLFILWNFVAFTGHWAEVLLSPQEFIGGEGDFSRRLILTGMPAWVYFFAKFDHLILVPAFFLLACGLKALLPRPKQEGQ